jgi:hypothetical protein
VGPFLSEAIDRPLVGGAVDPRIGDGGRPFGELLVQVDVVHEVTAGEEIALEVFDARLDLAFGLGPIGLTESGLEAPVFRVSFGRPATRAGSLSDTSRRLHTEGRKCGRQIRHGELPD